MNELEKQIQEIKRQYDDSECGVPDCKYKDCVECVIAKILALLQPSQPAEGELADNPYPDAHYPGCQNEVFEHGSKAQRQHMIAQGYVKLPSEDELSKLLAQATKEAMSKDKSLLRTFDGIAHELHRLLKEEGK